MTNETVNEVVEVNPVEETKPAVRRTRVKPKKTGEQIVDELHDLQVAVEQLEAAIANVEAGTIIHELASKELTNKRQQLEDSLNSVYTFA
jgi:hypothetical protein